MNELGKLLKELRGKRSLRDVSKITSLSHTYISDLEKGFNHNTKAPINPSPDTLKRLANAYDYPYPELLRVTGYIETDKEGDASENDEWPEGIKVFQRAKKELSPKERKKVIKMLEAMMDEDD